MVAALQVLFLASLVACVGWLGYLGWITRHDA
jgi:hypothetical protein